MKKKQVRKIYHSCKVSVDFNVQLEDGEVIHRFLEVVYNAEEVDRNYNKSQDWWIDRALSEHLIKKGWTAEQVTLVNTVVVKE